jgi:type IV pilus assembly protein PilA
MVPEFVTSYRQVRSASQGCPDFAGILIALELVIVRRAHGFTLIELLIVVAIAGMIAAMAIPQLLRARMNAQEAGAISSLRAISSAQATYASSCGGGGYATDLADLAKAPVGSAQAFISPDLNANGVYKSGYIYTVVKNNAAGTSDVLLASCNGAAQPRATAFFGNANPLVHGSTGTAYYATDTPGVIYKDSFNSIANPIPADTRTLQ